MEFNQEAREKELAEFNDPYSVGGEAGEDDETLSFCDLPIYGDEAASCREDGDSSSFSSSSFSSTEDFFEFSSPLKATVPENFMFFGKLIHYKKDPSSDHEKAQTFNGVGVPVEKHVKSARKVSGAKPSLSSRWHLLVFGLAKFPGHMEMRDIKKRQNTRKSSSPASYESNKCSGIRGEIVKGKGIWALLRAIGCSSQRANSMVKASLGCVPKI